MLAIVNGTMLEAKAAMITAYSQLFTAWPQGGELIYPHGLWVFPWSCLMGLWLQLSIVTSSGVWWYWCSPTSHLPDCASWLFLHVLCGFAIVFLPLPTSGIRSSIFFFCIYRGHHETIFIYRVPYFDDVGVFLFPTHLSW